MACCNIILTIMGKLMVTDRNEAIAGHRLIHIHMGEKGGAERFFVHLVNGLAEKGVDQIAFTRPDRVWWDQISDVCPVYGFKISRSHIKRRLISWRMARIAEQFRPTAYMAWMGVAARWIPANRPKDVLTFTRLGDYPEVLDHYNTSEYLVANTPDIVDTCIKLGWSDNKIKMISNFTESEKCHPISRDAVGTPLDVPLIVATGRFVERKGFDTLIEAMSKVPNAHLWLVGDGPELENLQAQAKTLGLEDRVKFIGWVTDPARYVSAADVFCCPSRHEPLGNVVLEGWAQKVPVVATASEGPSWLIKHEHTGLICPVGDAEQLSVHLNRLCKDNALGQRLVDNADEYLNAHFVKDVIVDQYLKFLGRSID